MATFAIYTFKFRDIDSKVRGVWDDEQNKWFFSVLDIIGAINEQEDYRKNRNYWKYLKAKLKKEQSELVSVTTQLKLLAPIYERNWLFVLLRTRGITSLRGIDWEC